MPGSAMRRRQRASIDMLFFITFSGQKHYEKLMIIPLPVSDASAF
jgi:hypothetical protein